jgi:hypothetical protein
VWAECLASHIAELLGLSAQSVTIKTTPVSLKEVLQQRYPENFPNDWQPIGTLARNIFPKNIEITYGAAIVETPSNPLTLLAVEGKIRQRYYAPDDLLQSYSDMVIFDVLIGNMDRHHENWGVCEDKQYKQQLLFDKKGLKDLRYFTPLFDHGSSLMYELSDKNKEDYLNDESRVRSYVEENKFGFLLDMNGQKNNVFTIIHQHLEAQTPWAARLKKALKRVSQIDLLALAALIIQMPSLPMLQYDASRRRLLYKSMIMRYNKLNELYERG